MGAVTQLTNSISHALGTDGSGGGLAGEISKIGKDIANDPILSTAISAAASYFGVPPAMTAALLGANRAGQDGNIMAGLQAGLGSYAVGSMTANLAGTAAPSAASALGGDATAIGYDPGAFSAVGDTTAIGYDPGAFGTTLEAAKTASTAPSGTDFVTNMFNTVKETAGKAGEMVDGLLNGAGKVGGNVIDKVTTMAGKAWDKNPELVLSAGMKAIGGAYEAGEKRAEAERNRQSYLDQINLRNQNEIDAQNRYNGSFNLSNISKPGAYKPLRRNDGSLVFDQYGRLNTRSA